MSTKDEKSSEHSKHGDNESEVCPDHIKSNDSIEIKTVDKADDDIDVTTMVESKVSALSEETEDNIKNELKINELKVNEISGANGDLANNCKSDARHDFRAHVSVFQEFRFTKALRVEPRSRSIEVHLQILDILEYILSVSNTKKVYSIFIAYNFLCYHPFEII